MCGSRAPPQSRISWDQGGDGGARVGRGPISAMAQVLRVRPSHGLHEQLVKMHDPQVHWGRI